MDFNIGFLPYGPTWRHFRRESINFGGAFRSFEKRAAHPPSQFASFPEQVSKASQTVSGRCHYVLMFMSLTPGDSMAGQIIPPVAYGIDARPEGDPYYVEDAENFLRALQIGSSHEANMFDTVTWCNALLYRHLLSSKERNIERCIAQYSICRVGFREWASNRAAQVVHHRRQFYTIGIRGVLDAQFVPPANEWFINST